jgi:exodeoxyribonuclease V alpha subunit
VTWISVDLAEPDAETALAPVRSAAVCSARSVIDAARTGDAATALAAMGAFRVLCAHRRGDHGVTSWMAASSAGSPTRSTASPPRARGTRAAPYW